MATTNGSIANDSVANGSTANGSTVNGSTANDTDYTVPLWINSAPHPSPSTTPISVTSSITGQTLHHAHATDVPTAQLACSAASTAFKTWKRSPISTRRNLLLRTASLYEARSSELLSLQMSETSCDEAWALNNVRTAVGYLREIAACISTALQGTIPSLEKPDTMGFVFREAVGVVLVIPPWNAALILATRAIASALGAGCTVVLKASELCPRTHHAIVRAFEDAAVGEGTGEAAEGEAGRLLPRGALNQLQAGREQAAEVTEALIAHPAVRKVDFIGSAAVGRVIGATAARYLKPVLMELGGKCPAIVLEDADLGKAATLCAKGATLHHGQICFSTERIIVLRKAAEEFQNLLVKAFEANPSAGAAVTEAGVKHAEDVLRDAQEKGEKFLLGGGIERGKTATLKPAIILEPKSSRIVDEETFGPSASLYVVESDEEAIELANMSAYGLNATIHTKDLARGIKMAHELEYGQVHINSISVFTASTGSQGGVKGSGWGRQNAGWGLHEFLIEKFVSYHGDVSG
ncbi:aldehyde dehydrogenase [Viridothelium virens]|uniref:Aldehyde dehydrogenase n=1 Tax=Viridothelium virens TaxID=1048519 RepID=A0A6A6GUX0_VIRVR|nr:aldehyde dehydrogenase [Viridothelium virens]